MRAFPAQGLGPRRAAARPVESLLMTLAVAIGSLAVLVSTDILAGMNASFAEQRSQPSTLRVSLSQFRNERIQAVIDEAAFTRLRVQATAAGVPEAWYRGILGLLPPFRTSYLRYSSAASARASAGTPLVQPGESWIADPGIFGIREARIVQGRAFSEEEFRSGAPLVVLGAKYAEALLGPGSAVGKSIIVKPYAWIDEEYAAKVIGLTSLAEGERPYRDADRWIVLTRNRLDTTGPVAEFFVNKSEDAPKLVSALSALLRAQGESVAHLDPSSNYADALKRRRIDLALVGTALAIGLGTLLIALWTIGSVFRARLPSIRSSLSLLRALGARKAELVAVGMSEIAPLSLAGTLAGLAAAAAVRLFILKAPPLTPRDAVCVLAIAALSLGIEIAQVLPVLRSDPSAALRA